MRRRDFVVGIGAAAALTAAGSGLEPATAASSTRGRPVARGFVVSRDVRIPGSGGVILDGVTYTPPGSPPAAGWPLVVFPASWAAPKQEYDTIARTLAGRGYLGVAYTARGFLQSTGTILAAGPEDQADVSRVIDWAIRTAGADRRRIGTFGVSYGAGLGMLGASQDRRIRAVVALSGWMDLQDSLLQNGTVAAQTADTLRDTGRLTGRLDPLLLNAFTARDTGIVEPVIPLAQPRSPGRRVAALNRNRPALLVGNGWQDGLFPPSQFFGPWDRLRIPRTLLLAPGDHAGAEGSGVVGLPNEYVDTGIAWIEHYLGGVRNGVDELGPVVLRPSLGTGVPLRLRRTAALAARTRRYTLAAPSPVGDAGASLGTGAGEVWRTTWTAGQDSGAQSGAVLTAGLGYQLGTPPRVRLDDVDRRRGALWQTAPLSRATTLAGSSTLRVQVTPARSGSSVVGYLYDVDPYGHATLLSWRPWSSRSLVPGRPVPVRLDFEPILVTVKAGHRIAVVLDSFDARYRIEAQDGDRVTVSSTAKAPATLTLATR